MSRNSKVRELLNRIAARGGAEVDPRTIMIELTQSEAGVMAVALLCLLEQPVGPEIHEKGASVATKVMRGIDEQIIGR